MKGSRITWLLVVIGLGAIVTVLFNTWGPSATEQWLPQPEVVVAPADSPPSDAQRLFDGSSLASWHSIKDKPATWQILDNMLVVTPGGGDLLTKDDYCDIQLHLEWMVPEWSGHADEQPQGQQRSNSGVFLQDRYEVQILDSYQNPTYVNGQAGAVYKQVRPLVNASRPPGQWQSYDIVFKAPRFDAQTLLEPAYITVLHNGVVVQHHTPIQGATVYVGEPRYQAHGCAPIRLQDHWSRVFFRNIWVRDLSH